MADPKIPLSDLPPGQPGAYDKVAGVDTATGDARLFPMPQPGVPKAYETRASLPSASGLTAGTAAWVTNDPNPLLNGTWSVQGGVWVQSADRVTGLEGRVGDAENKVDVLQSATFEDLSVEFVQGNLNSVTGGEGASTSRLRSGFIVANFISVDVTPGQVVALYRYDAAGNYLGWTNFQSSIPLTEIEMARVLVRRDDSGVIVPGDNTAVVTLDRSAGLKAAIGDTNAQVETLFEINFTPHPADISQGSLNSAGGEVVSATRVRTGFIAANTALVDVDESQEFRVYRYDEDGSLLEWVDWASGGGTYSGPILRFVVRKKTDGNIVPGESTAAISVDSVTAGDVAVIAEAKDWADNLVFDVLDSSQVPLEVGSFSPSSGDPIASGTRVRSADFVAATEVSVSVPTGLLFSLWRYDENKNFVDSTSLSATPMSRREIPGYFKLLFSKANTSQSIVPAEVSFTASIFQDKFARAGADLAADLPVRPEGLLPEKLWADALTVKVVREYDDLFLSPARPAATHAGVYALMDALMAEFPDYVSRQEIGRSELDNPIYSYRLTPGVYRSDTPNSYPYETIALPKIILATGVHGDEPISIKGCLLYVMDLCRRWKELPLLADTRWGVDLIFVPLVNPDGYDANTRHNANDVNINRDFDILSQSESQALSGLISANLDAIAYIDHHNFGPADMANYALWVGAEGPSELGVASELIRQMTVDVRKLWSDAVPDDNSPRVRLSNHVTYTTTGGYAHTLGIDSFLLETPQGLPSGSMGVRVAAHAMTATARLINIIYQREMRRRIEHFDLS